jgi:hypothetical protein
VGGPNISGVGIPPIRLPEHGLEIFYTMDLDGSLLMQESLLDGLGIRKTTGTSGQFSQQV